MALRPNPAARKRFKIRKEIRSLTVSIQEWRYSAYDEAPPAWEYLIYMRARQRLDELQALITQLDAERDEAMAQRALARLPDYSVFED